MQDNAFVAGVLIADTECGYHARIRRQNTEALALLRELNDELKIPGWLQPRVDAILDKAESERE